jgi:hypothetical protein
MDSLSWIKFAHGARRKGDAPHPLTLTEVRAFVKNSRGGRCAIANAQQVANSNKN